MLKFIFPEKGLGLVSPPHSVYDFSRKTFSCYILLTDKISLSECLYFWRYWGICVLQLFIHQTVTSSNLRLTYRSNQLVLLHDQNVKIKI